MPNLITLTGPSQAGKSKVIELFLKHKNKVFLPVGVPKFTTRKPRSDDKPSEVITVSSLPGELDLVYQQYDVRYGVSSEAIVEQLKKGFSPILVLNDIRLIIDVKKMFGSLTRSIFLFRKPPRDREFVEDASVRGDEISEETVKRFEKAEAIYRIYIENIHLFDHVILNADTVATLETQIIGIINSLSEENVSLLQ